MQSDEDKIVRRSEIVSYEKDAQSQINADVLQTGFTDGKCLEGVDALMQPMIHQHLFFRGCSKESLALSKRFQRHDLFERSVNGCFGAHFKPITPRVCSGIAFAVLLGSKHIKSF